jgi:hypothetical protein
MYALYVVQWKKRSSWRILLEKPEGKRPLERPTLRMGIILKIDI